MAREKQITPITGIELVRRLSSEGDRIFTSDRARQFASAVGLSEGYFRQALHHLVQSGWLIRIRKGLYVISSTIPGISPVHEFEIAMALVNPSAISHWSAMHYHGLTDQAPGKIFVLTSTGATVPRQTTSTGNHRREGFRVGDTIYQFVQTRPERFFGTEKVWVDEARVTITNMERTLIDGLSRPQYCGDFSEVLHAFESGGARFDAEKLVSYAIQLDAATAKRLGWVMEKLNLGTKYLGALQDVTARGYRPLDPTGPRRGPCNRRWMIQENLPGRIKP